MTDLHKWARAGAQTRLAEIQQEVAAICWAFPDLGGTNPIGARRPGRPRKNQEAPEPQAKRKARYKMSAKQKAAVSARMKKYWAARRKEKNG